MTRLETNPDFVYRPLVTETKKLQELFEGETLDANSLN